MLTFLSITRRNSIAWPELLGKRNKTRLNLLNSVGHVVAGSNVSAVGSFVTVYFCVVKGVYFARNLSGVVDSLGHVAHSELSANCLTDFIERFCVRVVVTEESPFPVTSSG